MSRDVGIPADIIAKLRRRKKISPLDINILWGVTKDAIEFLESVIDAEQPHRRNWRKLYPEDAKKIDHYRESLKLYRRAYRHVVREGNTRNWK